MQNASARIDVAFADPDTEAVDDEVPDTSDDETSPHIAAAREGKHLGIVADTMAVAEDYFEQLAEHAGDDAEISRAHGAERIAYPSGGFIVTGVKRGSDAEPIGPEAQS